ncbi:MAG: 3-oxoacyl-[acyl-carrier-protein] reductase [Lachnospiraceae bacterium]|nr:3-oxoacyl-[acyl-carrier-protein] reductase [Lachnospiraceae bacterium]
MFDSKLLEGKVALVTGASRGIGRSIALSLAKCGSTVLVNYNGSKEAAEDVVKEIESFGGFAEAYGCNVSDYEACKAMTENILGKYNKVDILVNNAGITRDNLIMRMSEKDYDDVLTTNLKGAFNTISNLSRNFLKNKAGKIINISSVSGIIGNAGQANYSASKAGLIGLTKSVARELGSRGICANAVAPGFIETQMTQKVPEDMLKKAEENIVLKHIGQPEDVANAVVFLASKYADYITGQVICVDGGMAM